MGQVTFRDLNEWIDIQAEQDSARSAFEAQQSRRRNLNGWLVVLLPWSQLIVFVVFYLLSAPHTVYLVERITPGAGKLAPIGLELGVIFVAAMRQKKWRGFLTFSVLWALMLVNVIINVGGGFIAVVQSATAQDMGQLTLPQIIGRFGTLPAEYQILFPLVVIIGALVPVMGKFSGEAVIKLATGEIKLESVSIEDLWLKERTSQTKSALMRAALKKGAGTRTAGAWAQRVVDELFGIDEDDSQPVQAMAGQLRTVPIVPTVSEVRAEMGFAAKLPAPMDTQNTQDDGTRVTVLRAKLVSEWVDAHPDDVRAMLARPGNKRAISQAISQAIAGSSAGYKTVERVLKAKGYDF
jgi:hypothetical protein